MLRIRTERKRLEKFEEIGRGGEAVIYRLKPDTVAKVFHLPNAAEYKDSAELREAAKVRLREMQIKLFGFPRNLPAELVAPKGVLIDESGAVIGYVMPFVSGEQLELMCRTDVPFDLPRIRVILLSLYDLVSALHAKAVEIGDFNSKNVIVVGTKAYLVDADSMQFGHYECRTFFPRFTAPELLELKKEKGGQKQFFLVKKHNELTDWYSFLVIAMRLITLTDPFGGTMVGVEDADRLEKRITLFQKEVVYPVTARPLSVVPRKILKLFFDAFHHGERFVPSRAVFENADDWTCMPGFDKKGKRKRSKRKTTATRRSENA